MPDSPHPVLDAHRQGLRSAFAAWLLVQDPAEVLDLGAGDGSLVHGLGEAGVSARGLELPGASLERARSLGRPVEAAKLEDGARALPSARWITVRHVLHHLEDPRGLVQRAAAAAGSGLLLAEPISTTGLPMHAWTARLEALTRALDRASGMHHAADHTPAELLDMLPPEWSTEVRIHAPMTRVPEAEARAMIDKAARGGGLSSAQASEADAIVRAASEGLLAPSGSAMVMATPPR